MSAVGRNEGGYHYHSYDVHSRRGRGVPHRQSRGYGSSSQTRRIVQTSQGRTRLELNINYDAFRNVDTYQVDREKQPDYGPFSIDDYLSHFYRTVKRGCRPKEAFFKLFLRSLTDKGFLLEAKKILDLIGKSIDKRSAVGLLIKEFGLKGEVAEAKVLYDSLSAAERNSTLISTMMSVYGNSCDLDSVEEFYSSIPQQSKTAHTDQAYEAAKRKCREKKGKGVDRVFEAKHAITSDASHRNNVNAELVEIQTTAEFIKIHARAGMIDAAGALYTDATKRFGDRVELKAAMIYSYGEAKMLRQALQIFNTIQFSEMTASVAAAMINVFGKMGNIEEAKIHFQNIGFEEDSSVVDSMVVAYCDVDKVDEARELFEKYPDQVRSEESHMALIECYGKKGSIDEAAEVFDRIRAVPKSFESYRAMVEAYAKNGMWIKAKALYEIMPKQYKWIEGIIERLKKCENIDEFQTIIEELIQQIQKKSDQCDLVRLLNGANLKTLRCHVSYMILFSGLLTFEITIKLLEKILWANPSAESIEFTLGGPISTIKVDRDNQMRDLLPIKLILQGAIINYHEQWKSSDFPNEEEKLIITRKEDTATANPHKKLKRTEEEEWSIGLFDRTATSS